MRRLTLAAMVLACATLSPARATEPEIRGARTLLAPGTTISLGEMHGTVEAPRAVADLALLAVRAGYDIEVGLEISTAEQPAFDRYLESSGQPSDRTAVLAGAHWHAEFPDGRSSEAMLDLIERIRCLRHAGHRAHVFGCVGVDPSVDRDRSMALTVAEVRHGKPSAVVLLLAGNNHTRTDVAGTMGSELRASGIALVSLNLAHGPGNTWGCSGVCGPVTVAGTEHGTQRYIELSAPAARRAFDGVLYVGAVHASPPAIRAR